MRSAQCLDFLCQGQQQSRKDVSETIAANDTRLQLGGKFSLEVGRLMFPKRRSTRFCQWQRSWHLYICMFHVKQREDEDEEEEEKLLSDGKKRRRRKMSECNECVLDFFFSQLLPTDKGRERKREHEGSCPRILVIRQPSSEDEEEKEKGKWERATIRKSRNADVGKYFSTKKAVPLYTSICKLALDNTQNIDSKLIYSRTQPCSCKSGSYR